MDRSVPPDTRSPELRPALGSIAFLDDAALATLVGAGDGRAFEVVYARHRGEVFRYCSAVTRDPRDAEEAFGLTMLSAHRALATGHPPRSALKPWLLGLAHDECMDLLRARREVAAPPGRDDRLRSEIGALPLRQRSALVLHELNGLPHAAVADALGTEASVARTLLHDALATLADRGPRDPGCRDVRRRIGGGGPRATRARAVRAHLRDCAACATFAEAREERRRRMAAWSPVLPEPVAEGILRGILAAPGETAAGRRTGGASGGVAAALGACLAGVVASLAVAAPAPAGHDGEASAVQGAVAAEAPSSAARRPATAPAPKPREPTPKPREPTPKPREPTPKPREPEPKPPTPAPTPAEHEPIPGEPEPVPPEEEGRPTPAPEPGGEQVPSA